MEIDKKTINLIKQEWREQNFPIGKLFGYPECCIEAFCNQPPELMTGLPSEVDKIRLQASYVNGRYTGFIPCEKHAKEILNSKITLKSLITNRLDSLGEFTYQD